MVQAGVRTFDRLNPSATWWLDDRVKSDQGPAGFHGADWLERDCESALIGGLSNPSESSFREG